MCAESVAGNFWGLENVGDAKSKLEIGNLNAEGVEMVLQSWSKMVRDGS